MPIQRIKGQESRVIILEGGNPLYAIDTIKSTDLEFDFELIQEGYLGETFDRFDEVFNGLKVSLDIHMSTAAAMDLAFRVRDRAQRRAGGFTRIDLLTTFSFGNGDRRGITARDIYFEPIPISIGGRKEHISMKLSGACSEADRLTI